MERLGLSWPIHKGFPRTSEKKDSPKPSSLNSFPSPPPSSILSHEAPWYLKGRERRGACVTPQGLLGRGALLSQSSTGWALLGLLGWTLHCLFMPPALPPLDSPCFLFGGSGHSYLAGPPRAVISGWTAVWKGVYPSFCMMWGHSAFLIKNQNKSPPLEGDGTGLRKAEGGSAWPRGPLRVAGCVGIGASVSIPRLLLKCGHCLPSDPGDTCLCCRKDCNGISGLAPPPFSPLLVSFPPSPLSSGVQEVEVQLENQSVLVTTTLPSQEVQSLLENTGRQAVLKGMGSHMLKNLGAAVAMLGTSGAVQGVVRFLQVSPQSCLIEGTIDGLEPGPHGLHVHQYGDLTQNCASCGDHFNPDGMPHGGPKDTHRHLGDLGNIYANADGRATFRMEDERLKVWDIIGRSLVVDAGEDDLGQGGHPLSKVTGNSGERLACGIIARSAGLFQNPKQICSCDGLTIWEERGRPLAGEGRRKPPQTPAHL
ncbi:copper chaperone for superoxide dismutase isoform X2 [Notamacropus eugenii]|uniref:copper chaperone for superoxide dismutase isoform X2 n=1 Tax=Notamacropus eugenii TaxID=9315 RepID=UPI003B67552F